MQLFFRPANLNGVTNTRGSTPLIRMIAAADTEMIKLLLQHKADPTLSLADQQTTIIVAITSRASETQAIELVKTLKEAGVDINTIAQVNHRYDSRGGTALHKLYFDPPRRYSEDIDLVQVVAGPIGGIMDAVRARLDPWLGVPHRKQGPHVVTLTYRFESEPSPVTPLKLKVEINTREHFTVFGVRDVGFRVENPWYDGSARLRTYDLEELLGTKLRALFQRKKGRDLFDLSEAIVSFPRLDADKVVACFEHYLKHDGRSVTRADFEKNLAEKVGDNLFLKDVPPLLGPETTFNPQAAFELVRARLLARLA